MCLIRRFLLLIMANLLELRSFVVLTLGIGHVIAITCPDIAWVQHDGNCYQFGVDEYKNFYEAEISCKQKGGQLVHVDNKMEDDFIKGQLQALNKGTFWIGLTDFLTEGNWVYFSNRRNASYFGWAPGEPNSYQGQEEDCAAYFAPVQYQWVDSPCDIYAQPICEIPPSSGGTGILG